MINQDPNYRPPLTLTPKAEELLDQERPVTLSPAGQAELEQAKSIPLSPLLKKRLQEFTTARRLREQARGKEILPAMEREDCAAIELAWALEASINQEFGHAD